MKWISVEDRLPHHQNDVIATDGHDTWILYHGRNRFGDLEWKHEDGQSFGMGIITHWMPLPEPPQPEGEG